VLGIVGLPYITTWLNEGTLPIFSPKPNNPVEQPGNTLPDNNEIEYYAYDDALNISLEGFLFQNFSVDVETKTLNFQIVNQKGKVSFFVDNIYYLELYTQDKLLLHRFKIPKKEVVSLENISFNLSKISQMGDIALVAFVKKEVKDYPQVTLRENVTGNPILTCSLDNRTLTYEFEKEEDKIYLIKIGESTTYMENSTADYEEILSEIALQNNIYNGGVLGLKSEISYIRSGFHFLVDIDLKNILSSTMNRYFTEDVYYPKRTEAKTIAFELESSGYTCD